MPFGRVMREVSSVAAVFYMPEDYEDAAAPSEHTKAHHLTCKNGHVLWVLTRSGQITPRFQIHLNIALSERDNLRLQLVDPARSRQGAWRRTNKGLGGAEVGTTTSHLLPPFTKL